MNEKQITEQPPYTIRNNPNEIINQLYREFFSERAPEIEKKLRKALETMISDGKDEVKIQKVSDFLSEIWKNYAHEKLAEILTNFPKIEKILLGARLAEKRRYRDHFLHMFNTYIFGSLIISHILKYFSKNTESLEKIFKISSENDNFPFKRAYSVQERILFLWTITSSFHDVGVPIENLGDIHKGLNNYLENFGLHLSELNLEQHTFVSMKLLEYLDLLSRYYESGFIPNSSTGKYEIKYNGNNFVENKGGNRVFLNKIINNLHNYDHGIISAICLLRGIEDAFLSGKYRQGKYEPSIFPKIYEEYVFKQDIMRAALGITLHTFEIGENDTKIDFEKFPFAYLLILCDEIQEFYRTENVTIENITKLKDWPIPIIKINESPLKITIEVIFNYEDLTPELEELLLDDKKNFLNRIYGRSIPEGYNYAKLLDDEWREITEKLKQKLTCSSGFLEIILGYNYKDEETHTFKITGKNIS